MFTWLTQRSTADLINSLLGDELLASASNRLHIFPLDLFLLFTNYPNHNIKMGRFRKNIRTPSRYQKEGVSPVRPRSDVLMNTPLEDNESSTSAPECTSLLAPLTSPVPNVSSVLQVAAPTRQPPVKVQEAMEPSTGNRGGVTRFYAANTFHNLTDAMKLVIGVEFIEVLGTWEVAAEYLKLDQEECDLIRQLSLNEKDQEASLDARIKDLEARQLQILLSDRADKFEKWQEELDNFHAHPLAPEAPVVRGDDVDLAQRFLKQRCPAGISAILNKVLQGLPDYIGQDFTKSLRPIVHDDESLDEDDGNDEDNEGEIEVELSSHIQRSLTSMSGIQQSLPSSPGANQHLPRIPTRLSIVQTADSTN